MRLDWLTVPLTYYAVLAAVIIACLYLFVTAQIQLTAVNKRRRRDQIATCSVIDELRTGVATVKAGLHDAEQRAQAAEALAQPQTPQGMNVNKRTLVLRMARRGERPDQIAAALRLPQNEVDLVLKVHRSLVRAL
jgi:hypothetical protein